MKTKNYFFSILFALFLIFGYNSVIYGQVQKETRKEKKERQSKEILEKYKVAEQLIKDSTFVIAADRITFKDGFSEMTQSNINFLKVYKNKGVLQIAPTYSARLGQNGLGGITVKGRINKYELSVKKKSVYLKIYLNSSFVNAVISVSLKGSPAASVFVSGMFSGPAFTLYGPVTQIQDTRIFEGSGF